jgi:hypothetical protein
LVLAPGAALASIPAEGAERNGTALRPVDAPRAAAAVKAELLHAWRGYERYAWGHDALKPLSQMPHDWYGTSLLMTPVDALDTLILAGLNDEADKARALIDARLDFDQDIEVKNFEITIRLLGGLLSGYQLTSDPRLLELAKDLGKRLLPVFDSATGLPYVNVNLRTGKTSGRGSNPAETGTLLLEFGTLSRLTGEAVYYDKAKRALVETYKRRSPLGLVGDSYYEYLWKCWDLFADRDCLDMWRTSIAAVNRYLPDAINGELWYGYADMNSGKRVATQYGALDAFFPAVLALSGDVARARRLQESSFRMWNLHGIEPEVYDYRARKVVSPGYALRPEIVESTYYLHHLTGDEHYRRMGLSLFHDFRERCRVKDGYAALADVVSGEKKDSMESYVFAETFKYFYLLFARPETLDFDGIVFNTEAHPLKRSGRRENPPHD